MRRLNASTQLVYIDGTPTPPFRDFLTLLEQSVPYSGAGSPEGVVEAPLYSLYLDTTGVSPSISWRKMQNDIGGDTKMGWALT